MAWTWPTAAFFIGIAMMLIVMTIIELKWPGVERRGFLPLVTSRGDRLFISLLTAAYLHLAWLALMTLPLFIASFLSVVVAGVLMRWG